MDSNGIVENRNDSGEPYFNNINSYAVNGAIHYANAILHHTSYSDVIAIGMTGEKDTQGEIQHKIGVYYVSKTNLGAGQEVGKYDDFSFLSPENFPDFIEKVKLLNLSEADLAKLKAKREAEIDASLTKLNNDIYKNESGLSESDRVYLVSAVIMATLGAKDVTPLEKADLASKNNGRLA